MAKQVIGVGSTANDGTGDPIRTAFTKAMSNFDELYTDVAARLLKPANVAGSAAGDLLLTASATPSTPGTGILGFSSVTIAGRQFLAAMRPDGRLDPILGTLTPGSGLYYITASQGSTTLGGLNVNMVTGVATATGVTPGSTSRYFSGNWLEYIAASAAGAVAGARINQRNLFGGPATNEGGYFVAVRFALATGVVSTNRAFCGVYGTASNPTDIDLTTLTICAGFALDTTDANWQFIHNDSSGAPTKVDLGASFARPTADRQRIYHAFIHSPPGGGRIDYELWDETSGVAPTKASGSVTTNIPLGTAPMAPWMFHSTGGLTAGVGFGLSRIMAMNLT